MQGGAQCSDLRGGASIARRSVRPERGSAPAAARTSAVGVLPCRSPRRARAAAAWAPCAAATHRPGIEASGAAWSSVVKRFAPATPSIMQWCTLISTRKAVALEPVDEPHLHSGRLRSSGCDSTSPTRRFSSFLAAGRRQRGCGAGSSRGRSADRRPTPAARESGANAASGGRRELPELRLAVRRAAASSAPLRNAAGHLKIASAATCMWVARCRRPGTTRTVRRDGWYRGDSTRNPRNLEPARLGGRRITCRTAEPETPDAPSPANSQISSAEQKQKRAGVCSQRRKRRERREMAPPAPARVGGRCTRWGEPVNSERQSHTTTRSWRVIRAESVARPCWSIHARTPACDRGGTDS